MFINRFDIVCRPYLVQVGGFSCGVSADVQQGCPNLVLIWLSSCLLNIRVQARTQSQDTY